MHVIGVSRTPRKAIGFDEIASLERLRDAAAKADYLINVLPAVAENSNLFNAATPVQRWTFLRPSPCRWTARSGTCPTCS